MRSTLLALATSLLAAAPSVAQQPDDPTWLTLSGAVVEVAPHAFVLDYGTDMVTVTMDNWDRGTEALRLNEGDEATVTGRVDDHLFETATIHAASVFVEKLNTFFSSEWVDEENALTALTTPVEPSAIAVHGTVTRIEGSQLIVDSGVREIRVDTGELGYDPFDDEGFHKVGLGDRIIVSGQVDHTFLTGRALVADMLVSLEGEDSQN